MSKPSPSTIMKNSSMLTLARTHVSILRSRTAKMLSATLLLCALVTSAFATDWQTKNSGDLTDLNNWEEVGNAGNTPAPTFMFSGDTWLIKDVMTMSTGWSVEGDVTIDGSGSIDGNFYDVNFGGSFSNNGSLANMGAAYLLSGHGGNVIQGNLIDVFYVYQIDNPSGEWAFNSAVRCEGFIIANGSVTGPAGLTIETNSWGNYGSFTHNGCTVKINAPGGLFLDGNNTGTNAFNNLILTGGNLDAGSNFDVLGNLTMSNTLTVYPGVTVKIAGDFTNTGNLNANNGSTIEFNGTTQSITGATTFSNLTLSNSGTKTANNNITVNGTLNVGGGIVLDLTTTSQLLGTLAGISNSGTIRTQNTSALPIPSFKSWDGTVNFNGSGAQTIPQATFANLVINNASGAAITNGTTLTVNNDLHLMGGRLIMGTPSELHMGPFTTTSGMTPNSGTGHNITGNNSAIIWFQGGTPQLVMDETNASTMSLMQLAISGSAALTLVSPINLGNGLAGTNAISMSGTATLDNNGFAINCSGNIIANGATILGSGMLTMTTAGTSVAGITISNITANTAGTINVAGNLTVSSGLTVTPGTTLNMGTNQLLGAGTFTNNGTITTQSTSSPALPSGMTWGGTVVYDNTTTDQNVADGTYNNLTVGGATGAVTYNAASPIVVNGTLMTTLSTTTLNLSANPLTGTLSGVVNNGTIRSQDGSTAPLPPGKNWGGTVYLDDYVSSTRSVVAGTYNNLYIDENGVAEGDFFVNGTFGVLTSNFDMRAYQLSGLLTSFQGGGGSFRTQNTSATPVPADVNWAYMTFIYNHPSATQTIVAGTYSSLTPGTAAVTNNASGNISAVTVTISAGATFDMGTYTLLGPSLTGLGSGTLLTQNTSSTPLQAGRTWSCPVVYNATANQTVVGGNYNTSLTVGGASGTATYTASGNVRANGILTTALATTTLDMSTFQLLGTLTTINNNGTIATQNTDALPVPTGKTWGGTVNYNASAGGQTVVTGTYNNLTIGGAGGTWTAGGPITLSGTGSLTVNPSNTLNMGINALLGTPASISMNGSLVSASTNVPPIPGGFTYNGTVQLNGIAAQSLPANNTYNNLRVDNSTGASMTGNTTVNAVFAANGPITMGSNTFTINGTLTGMSASNVFVANGSSSITIGGTGPLNALFFDQTSDGTTNTLNSLSINRTSSGMVNLGNKLTTTSLTLTNGLLDPGANTFAFTNLTAPAPGAATHIVAWPGSDVRRMTTGGGASSLLPIGNGVVYTPVTMTVAGTGGPASYVTASTTGTKHPSNNSATNFLNRYWTIASSGITSPAITITNATYAPAEVSGTENSIRTAKFASGTWTKYNVASGNALSTSTGITDASFALSGITRADALVSISNVTICAEQTATLTAIATSGDAPYTYQWHQPAGTMGTDANQGVSPMATTVYTVIVTDANTQVAQQTATVTVNQLPVVLNSNPTPICSGAGSSPIALTSSNGGSAYTWTVTADAAISGATANCSGSCGTSIPQNLTSSDDADWRNVTYTIIPRNISTGCIGHEMTLTQAVKPRPTVTTANPADICSAAGSSPIALTASTTTPATFTWTTSANGFISGHSATCAAACGTSIAQTLVNADNITSHNVVYTVTASADGCNSIATPITQVVKPLPVILTVVPSTTCSNGGSTPISLTATTTIPATYTWVTNADAQISGYAPTCAAACGTVIAQSLVNSDNSAAHNIAYTVTPTSNGCVGPNTVLSQSVKQHPDVISFSSASQDACIGTASTATITASLVDGSYTFNYTLSGANSGTYLSATVVMNGGIGTFTIPSGQITTAGLVTLTINYVTSNSTLCTSNTPSGNMSSFYVIPTPTVVPALASGFPGASLTINGFDFNTVPDSNYVYFGATRAVVNTATVSQLDVTIPVDANYAPITVVNNYCSVMGYSRNQFIPNFDNSPYQAGNINFANRVNYNTGISPIGVSIADIDNDGKADMVVTSKTNSWVSVYRNMSTSGVIDATSFPSRVDFVTGANPSAVAIGDLDNDGKIDLAVTCIGGRVVSVLRNTSSGAGSISFATNIDYITGFNPLGVAIRDLNMDGKSEIVVSNQNSNNVSVYQNNSTPGVISFNAKVDLATATAPSSIAIADIDGDGKPDLVTANTATSSNNVSVLRNLSNGGLITTNSFATRANFAAGTNPQGVSVGDLNGDGLPEIVATNSNGNNISVLRNTSTVGAVNFAIKNDFTVGTGVGVIPYSVAMGDLDGDNKVDLVVANQGGYSVSVFRNTSTGFITFEPKVNYTTGSNPTSVAVGDLDGDGKADIAVSNSIDGTFSILRSNPAVNPIAGASTVCEGMTTQLSSSTPGGVWNAANTAVATVDNSGLVTGVMGGTSAISYTVNGATSTLTVTVTPLPTAIIGMSLVCINANIQLSNAVGGGTWSSSNTAVATTNPTLGYIYGVIQGEAEITYATACGSITTTVTVSPGPSAIAGIMPVCPGATITLSNEMSGGTWSSNNTAVATVTLSTGIATGVAAGNTVIGYVTTCGISTATLTTKALPSAIAGSTSICPAGVTTLSNTVAGGAWTSSNTNAATIDPTTGTVTAVATGTTEITYTTDCSFVTTTVTVRALPSVIAGSTTVCPGATTSLSNDIAGGTWTSGTTSVATVNNATGLVTAVAAGTSVITYHTNCGSVTTTVTVNALPSAIAGTLAICPMGTTTLSNAVAGGIWSSSNTNVATVDEAGGEAFAVMSGTSTITYTTVCGSSNATLTVTTPPAISTGNTTVCQGATTTLSNSVTGGTWTVETPSIATVGVTTGVITGVSAGVNFITYTTACGNNITIVTVNALPSAITGVTTICPGAPGNTTILSNQVSGGTWTSSNTNIATIDPNTGEATAVASGNAIVTYTTECGSATKTITVSPLPGIISGAKSMCNSGTVTLSNVISGGSWHSTNGGVANIDITTGVVTPVAPGTTTISYALACGMTQITFTVMATPSVIAGSTSICPGSTTQLSSDVAGGVWSSSNPAAATVNPATGLVSATATPGTTTITYTTTCGNVATVVTVRTTPSAITGIRGMCAGSTTMLSSTTTGGTWSSDNAAVATVDEVTGAVMSTSGAGVAGISYNTDCGSTSVTVTVSPTPSAIAGATSVDVPNTIQLSNSVAGGTWSSEITRLATVSAAGVVTGVSSGTAIISYTTGTGCAITKNIDVNVACVGLTATLDNGGMPGGTWTSSNSTVATVVLATGVVSYKAAGTVVMTYRTPSATTTTTITVQPLAQTTMTGTGTACQGQTIALANNTAGGGVWSSDNAAIASVSNSGLVLGTGAGTAVIAFTTTKGCIANKTVTITAGATLSGASGVCQGQTTTLSSSMAGGAWSSSGAAIANVNAAGVVTGVNAGTVRISYMLPGGCASTVTVTVAALGTTTGTSTVCQGQYVQWTNNTIGGGGVWSSSDNGVATVSASGAVWGAGGGTASISYTLGGGCAVGKTITVNAIGTITGTTVVCVSATTQLSSTTPGGNWISSSSSQASVSAAGLVKGVATGTPGITYIMPNGCWSATRMLVNPLNQTTGGTNGMCQSGAMILTNNTAGGVWSSSNTSRATVTATGVVRGVAPGSVNILYTTGAGCVATRTITVNACREDNSTTTVTEAAAEDAIRLFPNPNKGQFTLAGTFGTITEGNVEVEVVNMLGQVIYKAIVTVQNGTINKQIELQGNLANGMYLLNIRTDGGNKLFHFMVGQ